MPTQPQLILASTSRYRRELLERLMVPFSVAAPLFDEETEKNLPLPPPALAERLAEMKARSLAGPGRLILGGDQLVSFEDRILGKPGTPERAIEQLTAMAGKSHELITAIALIDGQGRVLRHTDRTVIRFKPLTRTQIERVVALDNPVDCAGAYKFEAHGVALIDEIQCADFTAIQGLPLLALSKMLKQCKLESP